MRYDTFSSYHHHHVSPFVNSVLRLWQRALARVVADAPIHQFQLQPSNVQLVYHFGLQYTHNHCNYEDTPVLSNPLDIHFCACTCKHKMYQCKYISIHQFRLQHRHTNSMQSVGTCRHTPGLAIDVHIYKYKYTFTKYTLVVSQRHNYQSHRTCRCILEPVQIQKYRIEEYKIHNGEVDRCNRG